MSHPAYISDSAPECRMLWCDDTNGGMCVVQIDNDINMGFKSVANIEVVIAELERAKAELAAFFAAKEGK